MIKILNFFITSLISIYALLVVYPEFFIFSVIFLIISIFIFLLFISYADDLSIIDSSIFIFYILFFLLAPASQFNSRGIQFLLNGLPVDIIQINIANFLLASWLLIYTLFKYYFKFKSYSKSRILGFDKKIFQSEICLISNKHLIIFSSLIFLLFFLPTLKLIFDSLNKVDNFYYFDTTEFEAIASTITKKFIFIIPVLCLALALLKVPKSYFTIFIIALIFLFFKNPLVELRNGFGLAYLFILLITFRKYIINSSRLILLLFISIIFVFPLTELLSPFRYALYENINIIDKLINVFDTVHFDAWAHFVATLEFVDLFGYKSGSQILAVILFWIPRSIFLEKAISSSTIIGDFLMSHHGFWFNGISLTLPAEGILDFGYISILIYPLIFAKFSTVLDSYLYSENITKFLFSYYLSLSTIFIFRGPLLSSFSFSILGAISIWIGTKILINFKKYE
jgi:hypothetical protein